MTTSQFIPPKRTKRTPKAPPIETPQVSKDLKDQMGAIEALSITVKLLQEGTFQVRYHKSVATSVQFTIALYDDMVEKALLHPEADTFPELKEIKEQREKEVKDGKTQKQ